MASRLTGTLRMFLLGDKGGGMQTFPSSSAKNTLREWMEPPPPSALAVGSGNVDTLSGEQPQKPKESPWEDAGRGGEVEPWNALRGVSHLFTGWTQWTRSDSASSTGLSHRSLAPTHFPPCWVLQLTQMLFIWFALLFHPLVDSYFCTAYWLAFSPITQNDPVCPPLCRHSITKQQHKCDKECESGNNFKRQRDNVE